MKVLSFIRKLFMGSRFVMQNGCLHFEEANCVTKFGSWPCFCLVVVLLFCLALSSCCPVVAIPTVVFTVAVVVSINA